MKFFIDKLNKGQVTCKYIDKQQQTKERERERERKKHMKRQLYSWSWFTGHH